MIEQASREPYRVRGENVPVWLPWGLVTLGLIGGIITARLLLANWSDAFHQQSRPIEIGVSAVQTNSVYQSIQGGTRTEGARPTPPESAVPVGAQVATQSSEPNTSGQMETSHGRLHKRSDADSEQTSEETVIDCAPLFSVGFKRGSAEPQARDMNEKVTRLARWLSTHPTATIYVDGYADPSGPEEANLVLSFRRATALAALLRESGAAKAQLVARAYGENPALSRSSESEPQRRVSLKIDAGMPCVQQASDKGGL